MKNIFFKIIILGLVIFGIGIFLYSPVIFQEGNPWPQIKGVFQLNFTGKDLVKLSSGENKYITKSNNGVEIIKAFMKDKDYDFTEQMGSGYFFVKDDLNGAVVTHKYYSRFYSLWNITKNIKQIENNIAEELQECLPKSDMASHEKCQELLKTIRNFDDCAKAGFSIMKSNPPQCATPDGRNFIDETNSTWEMALLAINNCEVESVFQNHGELVTLKLKNGNKLIAYEPNIDDVMKVVDELNGRCGDIRLATE